MSRAGGPGRRSPIARFLYRTETLIVLAVTLALAAAYPVAREWGPFRVIDGALLDWRFRIRGPQPPGTEVVIVAVDDRTVAELGRWPLPRARLARAVDAVAADGARTVVFDLLLVGSESRGAVPAGRAADDPPGGASRETAADGADNTLFSAIARAGNVVVPFAFVYRSREANLLDMPETVEASAYRVVRSKPGRYAGPGVHPAGLLAPLASLLEAGRPAHVTVFLEPDGSLRYAHPAIRYGDAYYPSLAVEAARLYLGLDMDNVTLDMGVSVSIGARMFSTDERGRLAINYAGPAGTYESVPLIDVINGNVPAGRFRDKVVLVGTTAAGLGDRFATPYSPSLPGVEVYANVIDNILGRGFLHTSSHTQLLDLLAIALSGLVAASLGILSRPAAAIMAAVLLIAVWAAFNLYGFVALQSWFNFAFPGLAILLGAAVVIAGRTIRESRLRTVADRQSQTLSRYVSPLAAAGFEHEDGSAASGGTQMAAVMFVDLVGFTRASETMTPADTARLLRRFHDLVERASNANQGIIDKFLGDGVLIVFGGPAAGPADAANAVACARRIVAEMADANASIGDLGKPALACSVGIHFGPVTIAEVGSSAHAQITVTGDTVNVASRLEGLTREWRTTVIISDATMEAARAAGAGNALDGFEALPIQQIRGRNRPMGVWAWPPPRKS